jgi:hypothetical protein
MQINNEEIDKVLLYVMLEHNYNFCKIISEILYGTFLIHK